MRVIGIIPARYESSRFPGKPLVDIGGKPMLWWVYNQCKKVHYFERVIVATDSDIIYETCLSLEMEVLMTGRHLTGTDRVGEVARSLEADLFVNIQGDEPLIEPNVIEAAITPFFNNNELQVTNLMTRITSPVDVVNCTIPKVITNKENVGIFLSRCPVPYPKGTFDFSYFKQVCVYGFKPLVLNFFYEYGKQYGKGKIEAIEDIEVLRFIENGIEVKYIEVESMSIAVDTPNDLERVREHIRNNSLVNH